MSSSLRPHESQHARPPCPSPTPGVHPDSHPSSQRCHPAISSSVIPFSSCPQSLPAPESFPMSQLFAWSGQSTGVSASASFPPKKSQDNWGCTNSEAPLGATKNLFYFLSSFLTHGASLVAPMGKNLPAMQETQVQYLGWEDPLEKGIATHSSILAWRIPWTEETVYRVAKSWTWLSDQHF